MPIFSSHTGRLSRTRQNKTEQVGTQFHFSAPIYRRRVLSMVAVMRYSVVLFLNISTLSPDTCADAEFVPLVPVIPFSSFVFEFLRCRKGETCYCRAGCCVPNFRILAQIPYRQTLV